MSLGMKFQIAFAGVVVIAGAVSTVATIVGLF
jgi:hypothetical protein